MNDPKTFNLNLNDNCNFTKIDAVLDFVYMLGSEQRDAGDLKRRSPPKVTLRHIVH